MSRVTPTRYDDTIAGAYSAKSLQYQHQQANSHWCAQPFAVFTVGWVIWLITFCITIL
jgi:hypothetical protein